MRNLQLVGLEGVAVLWFVGHHFVAVGTKGCRGMFLSAATATAAAATAATDAVLGHGCEEVGVLFHDEIELLALGFKFRAKRGRWVSDRGRGSLLGNIFTCRRQ